MRIGLNLKVREAMDIFSDEIHSKHFPLLVPCANGINNTGNEL
jgi:hypothetical protein